jgi:putative methionine-R-sulfoxide reductase with GAF domain
MPRSRDPVARAPQSERRRCIRQKLHTPVYASFTGPQSGMVVDLSELLDLHEEGFAIQTSERLEVNRAVTLCLDLPETKNYIHSSGKVIWSDDLGRGGIRFSALPENSRQILKEWLFVNLLIGCSNHAARNEQLAFLQRQKSPEVVLADPSAELPANVPASVPANEPAIVIPISEGSEIHPSLEAVRAEAGELGDDTEAVLQLITERATTLTGVGGAALALFAGDQMICRARAGEPAPPLGVPVDIKQGLSGECVRSGLPVSCDDTENDPRVDPEVCRALGIRSLMAVPVFSDFRVVGLLEIFSPRPRAFTSDDETVLSRLVELIPNTHREEIRPERMQPAIVEPDEIRQETSEDLHSEKPLPEELADEPLFAQEIKTAPTPPSRLLYRALLGLVVAVLAAVLGYLVGPVIAKRWTSSVQASQQRASIKTVSERATVPNPYPMSLADLQRLADNGDADAQWQMGVRFHNGEDVPRDDAQAMQWFKRAAEQGNVAAQRALGAYYFAGRGVPTDFSQAYFWSAIAGAQGDEMSKSRLPVLALQMTQSQIAAARQQAEQWIHAHSQQMKSAN